MAEALFPFPRRSRSDDEAVIYLDNASTEVHKHDGSCRIAGTFESLIARRISARGTS